MKRLTGGVTAPLGFKACGVYCGIKRKKPDLAILFSETPAVAVGLFTKNIIKAAPVILNQKYIQKGKSQAIVVNSGNANSCTGKAGLKDAQQMARFTAEALRIKQNSVLVASTGIIGKRLPLQKIKSAIPQAIKQLSSGGSLKFARAIMTTDTKIKSIAVSINLGGKTVKIGGAAKGAGMIFPHLATMLAFITTDAVIGKSSLKSALHSSVMQSFNSISVDGDTSTNDMVLMLANGLAKNKLIKKGSKDFKKFQAALEYVCLYLAKSIVLDGEGATKFIEVTVKGAKTSAQARKAAFAIANSNLVKTTIFGRNPNWGRVITAIGMADTGLEAKKLTLSLGKIKVFSKGEGINFSKKGLDKVFKRKEIFINVELGLGQKESRVWSCDLSSQYVAINARYT